MNTDSMIPDLPVANFPTQAEVEAGVKDTAARAAMRRAIGVKTEETAQPAQQPESPSPISAEPAPADVLSVASTLPAPAPHKNLAEYLLSSEGVADTVLPILAALETVSTRGESKGDVALGQQKYIRDQADREKQAKKDAIAEKVTGQKVSNESALRKELAAVDMDAPDAEKQIAHIAMKYGDPSELLSYAGKLATKKQTAPLTAEEISDIEANKNIYGDASQWASRPEAYRKLHDSLALGSGKITAGISMSADDQKKLQEQRMTQQATQQQPFGDVDLTGDKSNPALDKKVARLLRGVDSPDSISELNKRGYGVAAVQYIQDKLDKAGFRLTEAGPAFKYWGNYKVQNVLQGTDNLMGQLPAMRSAIQMVKRLGIPAIDQHAIEALKASGNVDAARAIVALTATTEDLAKITSGGNAVTNDQLALAGRMIKVGDTPEQAEAEIEQIVNINNARKAAIYARSGIYGKYAASQDKFLPPDIRSKIANGEQIEGVPSGLAPEPSLPEYHSEAEAIAAGHHSGERVKINGVVGTLQ